MHKIKIGILQKNKTIHIKCIRMTANGKRRIIDVENGGKNGLDKWQIDDDRLIDAKKEQGLAGTSGDGVL